MYFLPVSFFSHHQMHRTRSGLITTNRLTNTNGLSFFGLADSHFGKVGVGPICWAVAVSTSLFSANILAIEWRNFTIVHSGMNMNFSLCALAVLMVQRAKNHWPWCLTTASWKSLLRPLTTWLKRISSSSEPDKRYFCCNFWTFDFPTYQQSRARVVWINIATKIPKYPKFQC